MAIATGAPYKSWNAWHLAALLGGNVALALGPLWVRLADSGPVSAGFWRLALAIPFLALLARSNNHHLTGFPRPVLLAVLAGGLFFAFDISSWHLGIELTRLGSATLLARSASILFVPFGFLTQHVRSILILKGFVKRIILLKQELLSWPGTNA